MTAHTKRSGKPNAPRHGIYTKFVPSLDDEGMEGMDAENLADELAVARVHLKHALEQMNLATSEEARLAWHREVRANLETLNRLKTRPANKRQAEQAAWNSLLEAIRYENKRQKVRR